MDSHLERLGEVFRRLTQAGLKLKPEKCTLFADRVNYLLSSFLGPMNAIRLLIGRGTP